MSIVGALGVGCGGESGDRCQAAMPPEEFTSRVERAAVDTDLVVTTLSGYPSSGGCARAGAHVERADSDLFLVDVDVTAVAPPYGAALLLDQVRNYESFTDDAVQDERAADIEATLSRTPGLGSAEVIVGRCSEPEVTCRYWIQTAAWPITVDSLYLGRLDQYSAVVDQGDALVIEVGVLLGQVVTSLGDPATP